VWTGHGVDEIGKDAKDGKILVRIDPKYFRPTEVDQLLGDPRKAHQKLGWKHETPFDKLVAEMVAEDLKQVACEHRNNRYD